LGFGLTGLGPGLGSGRAASTSCAVSVCFARETVSSIFGPAHLLKRKNTRTKSTAKNRRIKKRITASLNRNRRKGRFFFTFGLPPVLKGDRLRLFLEFI
jgi:hypothetical protein